MKKSIKWIVIVATIGLGIGVVEVLSSDTSINAETTVVPGSVTDPVVTKSYIDSQVSSLVKAELAKQNGDQQQGPSGQGVEVVTVPLTKRLIAKDGTEFVVRAGKAVAYSSDANGISDLTDGIDIINGKSVPNNHLILFPRGGRGVQAAEGQKSGLTVLVRGEYELQQQ